eukprot:31176-Pelagococcus_subviridis.AAC.41
MPPLRCKDILAPASASYWFTRSRNSSSDVTLCMSSSRCCSSAFLRLSRDLKRSNDILNWSQSSTTCSTLRFQMSLFAPFSWTTNILHPLSICCVTFCKSRSLLCMSRDRLVDDCMTPLASAPSSCSCW